MKKTSPLIQKTGPNKTEMENTLAGAGDYTETNEDCITGECFDGPDDNQRTFVPPCDECDPSSLPSLASREAVALIELAKGRFLTNELWHQISPSNDDHDGRKVFSDLRNDHDIKLEWFYVVNTQARQHRIIPKCLPNIHKAIKHFWGMDLKAAERRARAELAKSNKTANRSKFKKGGKTK